MKKVLSLLLCLAMMLTMVTFTASASTAQEVADSISIDMLTNETAGFITKDLTLPNSIGGQAVTWQSSDDAIKVEGTVGRVTRPETEAVEVTLTATVGDVNKALALTVVPSSMEVIYQNNFGSGIDGFVGGTNTTAVDGVMKIDLSTSNNAPKYTFSEGQTAPFYVQFDVKIAPVNPGIDMRVQYNYDSTLGTTQYLTAYRFAVNGVPVIRYNMNVGFDGEGAFKNVGTQMNTMLFYIDPSTMNAKWLDGKGDMIPENGITMGNTGEVGRTIQSFSFNRASFGSPSGELYVDNIVIYRNASDVQKLNDLNALTEFANTVDFSMMSDCAQNDVTADLDFAEVISAAQNNGMTVEFASDNDAVAISGDKGVITRKVEDTPVKLTLNFKKGEASFAKTFEIKVTQIANPAKQAADAVNFELLTSESPYAITKDLDLSLTGIVLPSDAKDATIEFSSSDDSVLEIDSVNKKGIVIRGEEAKDVTLTITGKAEGRDDYSREVKLTVLPSKTYLFDSDNFGYSELVGKSVNALEHWSVTTRYAGTTYEELKIKDNNTYIETARTKTANGYNESIYSFADMKKTKKATVEMDLSLENMPTGAIYDIIFLGTKNGISYENVYNNPADPRLAFFRIKPTVLSIDNPSGGGSKAVTQGGKYTLRVEFDFETDTFDAYLDDVKINASPLKFNDSEGDYDGLSIVSLHPYRESVNTTVGIDNFSVYSINPVFTESGPATELTDRAMNIKFSSNTDRNMIMDITTDYSSDKYLKQTLIESNVDKATANPIVDFNGAWFIDKVSGTQTDIRGWTSAVDETAPPQINGHYIGANHGAMPAKATATGHGKTTADIGSIWQSPSGRQYCLVRVPDSKTVILLLDSDRDVATQNFEFKYNETGAFTHVSGATNTADINVEASTYMQLYSSTDMTHKYEIVVDGVKTEITKDKIGSYNCDELIITETYKIMDPNTLIDALVANKPAGGYTEDILKKAVYDSSVLPGYEPLMSYKQIITVKGDGTVITEVDHVLLKDVNHLRYGGYQYYSKADLYGGGTFRYLPGHKEFIQPEGGTNASTVYDFSVPRKFLWKDSNVSPDYRGYDGSYPRSYTTVSSDWNNPDIVPSRVQDYIRDADGKNVMAYMTGYLPIDDGAPAARKDKSEQAIYLYKYASLPLATKAYPMFVSGDGDNVTAEGATIKGASFRKYEDLTAFESNDATYYSIDHKDKTYYYIDFLSAGSLTIDLAKKDCIYNLTSIEENNYDSSDITYKQVGDTIEITSTGKGYLVLSAERQLETDGTYYNYLTGKAGARLVNYSAQPKKVKLCLASYKEGKLQDIIIDTEVTAVDANATVLTEFDVSAIKDGDSYKMFIIDSEKGVAPLSKSVTVEKQ